MYSNSPLDPKHKLAHPDKSTQHTIVDMGDEFYMVGKPHPMIDGTMRRQRITAESHDAQDLAFQAKMLREAGALVYGSNARAIAACRWLLGKG